MSGNLLALLELLLVFGLVGGFAGYQIWSVRKSTRTDDKSAGSTSTDRE